MTSAPRYEPGSFRDREARVFLEGGEVYRGLSARAAASWERLAKTRFFEAFTREGKLIGTSLASGTRDGWSAVLRHERVPFVSYPYEWSFSMLKDAALLQLELVAAALGEGMTLKDASSFNVQFVGARPVFIDIASFEVLAPSEPWAGYRQFCRTFLYPLLLSAYKNVPFQAWMRGSLEGIAAPHLASVLSARDLVRPGVLAHVVLESAFERRYGDTTRDLKKELREVGVDGAALAKANVARLRKLVAGLVERRSESEWSRYATSNSYTSEDESAKEAFVARAAARRRWPLVWDLGCNTGRYSRIAAQNAEQVVSMDADPFVIELLYRAARKEGIANVLPLYGNLADPTPALGWRNRERRTLAARGKPALTLCLALVHHLAIGANVPLAEVLDWLRELGGALVIEFVTKDDPMVKKLLLNKTETHPDYDRTLFERQLRERFEVLETEPLRSGTRVLYLAEARP